MADNSNNQLNNDGLDAVEQAKARAASMDQEEAVLSDELKDLFEPNSEDFSISNIPDRDAQELTQEELLRIQDMNLEDLFADANPPIIDDGSSIKDDNIDASASNGNAKEETPAEVLGYIIDEDGSDEDSSKKKSKRKKDKKNKKNKEEIVDGLPKKSLFDKIKGVFFEIDDESEEAANASKNTEENGNHRVLSDDDSQLDDNEKILKSMYGKDIDAELVEEGNPEKLGFFAKLKLIFEKKKNQNLIDDKLEDEAIERDEAETAIRKQENKEKAAIKKEEAKAAKAAKKAAKPPKQPKPKKPKKEKKEPKPGDILKIKPKTMFGLILFVSGFVILIILLNNNIHYSRSIKNANEYFQNGNYADAYDILSGVKLNEADYGLYDQVCVIMFLEKQIQSYDRFTRMNMKYEALDSLIKGIQRYESYLPRAQKLGLESRFVERKDTIVKLLLDNYGISYDKAKEYAALEVEDFVQYYNTINTYGGN